MSNQNQQTPVQMLLNRSLYWHRIVFIAGIVLLFLVDWWLASSGWLFWVLISWVCLFALHYSVVKSISVDEDWAYDRTYDLRQKSYDHKHIHSIRSSYIIPRKKTKSESVKNN